MENRLLLLICAFCFISFSSFSQEEISPCGTKDHRSDWLKHYQRYADEYDTRGGEKIYVPLTVFAVSNDNGTGEISASSLIGSLCTLNEDFKDANIHFYLKGGIKYLSQTELFTHQTTTDAAFQMFDLNIPNTVNCYIVGTAAGNCGYNLPYAGIVLNIGCLAPEDHTWAHEMGHQLSLPHPFLGWEGGHGYDGPPVGSSQSNVTFLDPAPETVLIDYTLFKDTLILDTLIIDTVFVEKVDRSNCSFAADGFCDTEPDYLAYRWNCTPSGTSIGFMSDPNGEQFKSDASLIMSYANDDCSYRFTDEQIAAMRANLVDEKAAYITNQVPDPVLEDPTVTYTFPTEGESQPYDYIELAWEPVENATHYYVKIGLADAVNFIIHTEIVTDPNVIVAVDDLYAGKTAYYSVAPFTNYEFCVDFQGSSTFFISNLSAADEIQLRPWTLLPSVVTAGSDISIYTDENLLGADIIIRNMNGQLIFQDQLKSDKISIASDWSSGIYLVQIAREGQLHTQKIVVR